MISAISLFGKHIRRLGLAHKILDTFEKMDTINPTFELIGQRYGLIHATLMYFPTLTIHLGSFFPFVQKANTHLNPHCRMNHRLCSLLISELPKLNLIYRKSFNMYVRHFTTICNLHLLETMHIFRTHPDINTAR